MPQVRKIDKPAASTGDADQVIRAASAAAAKLGWEKAHSTVDVDRLVTVSFRAKETEQEAAA